VFNPWRYASKRLDPELNLIYFGKRYYDPELIRWITVDPAGFVDGINLYQYVFNNSFRYRDPDGQFIIALPFLAKMVAIAAVSVYMAYEVEHQHKHSNSAFARSFNSAVHQIVQGIGGVSQYLAKKN
jgi:RHS repeat-associated protein